MGELAGWKVILACTCMIPGGRIFGVVSFERNGKIGWAPSHTPPKEWLQILKKDKWYNIFQNIAAHVSKNTFTASKNM